MLNENNTTQLRRLLISVCITTICLLQAANATALKVCNDTRYPWRVSVDYGKWQLFNPQPSGYIYKLSGECEGWDVIARKVDARWYSVQFQYLSADGRWYNGFKIRMWGGYFTNIVEILDEGEDSILLMFWEPGHEYNGGVPCRDKPNLEGVRSGSCLWPRDEQYRITR